MIRGAEPRLITAAWLALPLASLPLLLLLPLDTDRALPLAFLPAVCASWQIAAPVRRLDLGLLCCALAAMVMSAAMSPHAARALVMGSAVLWTLAGTFAARKIVACITSVRVVLAGLCAGSVMGTLMISFGADASSPTFPIYGSVRLFGAHQFVGCLAGMALLASFPSRPRTRLWIACGALVAWTGLFWSGSRAPFPALAVAFALWFWRENRATRRTLLQWTPGLAVVGLLASLALGSPQPGMGLAAAVDRTARSAGIEEVSSERTRFWTETWHYALQSPWIGHGADGYRFIQPAQNGSQPHNMLLQWFVEYGLLGAIPLGMLLARGIGGRLRGRTRLDKTAEAPSAWAGAALAGVAVYGLLDGVFYHAIVFMPAAVVAGMAVGFRPVPEKAAVSTARFHPIFRPLLVGAGGLMVLHGWLGWTLLHPRGVTPDAPPARMLRAFPSTTTGLQNWIETWRRTQPDLAMDWIHWAQTVSTEGASFHVYAAQIHIWQKNYKAAETELLQCLAKVYHAERADVQKAIDTVRALDAGLPAPQPPPQI